MVRERMNWVDWTMLIALSILWGGSFFFVGVVVDSLPPFTIVALRVALAAAALYVVLRVMGERLPRQAAVWWAFIGMGILNNAIPFCLIVWGQTHIASGLASILNAVTPIFAVIVAHLFTRDEKMTGARITGVVVGFVGVVIIIGPTALEGLGVDVWAQVAILGAALSYAFAGGVRTALLAFGRKFSGCSHWTGDSLQRHVDPRCLMVRASLDAGDARQHCRLRHVRVGLVVHSVGLHPLLSCLGDSGGNQYPVGDVPDSHQRHRIGGDVSGRAVSPATLYRHRGYRCRIGLHRWAFVG